MQWDLSYQNGYAEIFALYHLTDLIFLEYLQDLNETGSFSDETEKTPMCFIQCYLEKLKILNENGEVNKEVAIALYQIDNEETVDACNNEMGK